MAVIDAADWVVGGTPGIHQRPRFDMSALATNVEKLFRIGRKKIFLPNAQFMLLRSRISPYFAKFQVPLNCNKFDIRDYLYHIYGLRTLRVSTVIHAGRARRVLEYMNSKRPIGTVYRPRSRKIAFIQMEQPFVYPPPPTDMKPWDRARDDAIQEWMTEDAERKQPSLKWQRLLTKHDAQRQRTLARWGPGANAEANKEHAKRQAEKARYAEEQEKEARAEKAKAVRRERKAIAAQHGIAPETARKKRRGA